MPTLNLHLTLLLLTSPIFSMPVISDYKSAYEALESYDFPKALLPRGVQSFLLQPDGRFDVFFGGTCEFKVQGAYLLRYKRRISGRLVNGAVKDLKGVSVRALFVWVRIDQVVRTDDRLRFYSGLVSASFPVSSFDDCPVCRGFSSGLDRSGREIDEVLVVSFA